MKFQKTALATLAAIGLAVVSTQASAFSVSVQTGTAVSTQASVDQIDLGNTAVVGAPGSFGDVVYSGTTAGGLGYSFADGSLYTAAVPSVTAAPVGSTGAFWSVGNYPSTQVGPGELTFSGTGALYVGFLWGSVDSYNTVTFWSGVTQLGSYTGSYALNPANGNQSASGQVYFNAFSTSGQAITRITFASPLQNAFETDNFAVTAVPEPETYAMLLAGLGLMGTIVRRRNKSKAA